MTIDEAVTRYKNNAEHERTHGNLQGCLEFKQLAEWLKEYKRLLGAIEDIKAEITEPNEMDEYMRELSRQIVTVTQITMEEAEICVSEAMTAYTKANIEPFIQTKDLERLYLPAEIKRGIKPKKKRG